jgi:hypothetical protein
MGLTAEQKDIFLLAKEILETEGAKAVSCESIGSTRRYHSAGSALDWAIDYMRCLPESYIDAQLVEAAHLGADYKWSWARISRAGRAIRWFYARLQERRLYGQGVRLLQAKGG